MNALFPIMGKEVLHIVRDLRSLLASLALPVFMLLLFGYGISFDVRDVGITVLDEDRSEASRALVAALTADGAVWVVRRAESEAELVQTLDRGEARMGLQIPPDYGRDLAGGHDVPVQLLVDGTDATFAGQALARVAGSLAARTQTELHHTLQVRTGSDTLPGLVAQPRVLFNEPLNGTWFVIPGLIAVIVSMLAALVTSQCIAREYEQGTIEQILVSPVSGPALMLGKLMPYVGLGILQVLSVVLASRFLFGVPIRGSLVLLAVATLLYLFGSMAFGLVISAVMKNQQIALQVALLASMLPSLLLSGFAYPIANMPWVLQLVSYAVPARYFITIARGLFLKGAGVEA
ncbi:MAG: ABC-2 type transport system permease protein, partial [Myxococcota bacterium]